MIALLALLACRATAPVPPATSTSVEPVPSADTGQTTPSSPTTVPTGTHPTASTGASALTADTATDAVTVLSPSTVLTSANEERFAEWAQAVPIDDGPDALLIRSRAFEAEGYGTLLLTGPVPAGAHDIADIWDGTSGLEQVITDGGSAVFPIGDQNGDSVTDYWIVDELVPGPLAGRRHPNDSPDSIAHLELAASGLPYEVIHHVGFDYDGDGHDDILAGWVGGLLHTVYHGPFDGEIPDAGTHPDMAHYTLVGWPSSGFELGVVPFPDFVGPGVDAVAFGCIDFWNLKAIDAAIFPLQGPRGVHNDRALAHATYSGHHCFFPLHDMDGDGSNDLLFSDGATSSFILPGPFDDFEADTTDQLEAIPQAIVVVNGALTRPVVDLNRDGQVEFLANDTDGNARLLMSPHANPLDVTEGLTFEPGHDVLTTTISSVPVFHVADLDDDGVPDLIVPRAPFTGSNEPYKLLIYSGAEIGDAWATKSGP